MESRPVYSAHGSMDASRSRVSRISFLQDSLSRTSRPAFSFMVKRQTYLVIVDTVDVTPEDIIDVDYVTMMEVFSHAAFENKPRAKSEIALKVSKSFKSETGMKVYATTINLDDIHIDHTLNTEEGCIPDESDFERAPSAFSFPARKPLMSYPPEIFIVLKETETCFMFELPSFSYEKGTQEAIDVEEENEYYQYITVGKGRNRKMVVEETQTKACITQTRHTLAVRPQKKNAMAFAAMWDMHDTYARLAKVKPKEEPDEMVLYQSAAPSLLRKKKKKSAADSEDRGKTFEEIAPSAEFQDAVLVTERVLASLEYCEAQKIFRGLVRIDPLSLDLVYFYSMRPLWSLDCEDTAGRPITSITFNPKNENILAVAHGKFSYAGYYSGLVCVWCTKNPIKPERIYRFEDPLTSVSFSEKNPNWLACGFANGDVLILDIMSYTVKTIAQSKRETNPCFDPIWVTNWRAIDRENEYVMTTCQDGRINRFTMTKTHDFVCSPMMRVSAVEGKLKGLEIAKTCIKFDVPITRYPAVLCMKWHPTVDHIYLVGTDEGCVHKCSTHYLNQHMDVFRAHAGPIYGMEISPFMNKLLVTCGADNSVRLWIEGMDDVILTLTCPNAVYGIAFCPINATILISISGNVLSIWDIRRKTHIPCTEYAFANNVVLTFIKFSTSGDNVFVGDTTGKVHTFHLEDTPIPPFYQRRMLNETIKTALCTRPQLLKQLDKLEQRENRT
ncbi:putative axonemal dynein intermediate chain inner arm i1 [Operophtera brumata]|uniref:Dynein axonemal intermediate chain 4 n=1 Tax=Operophtera brumata TaxID=104452 RepID=A0A0L7LF19_OPEBR|nr:putative axonemal dynein intermediate chain inner arm i1 [Operophtera brumata]